MSFASVPNPVHRAKTMDPERWGKVGAILTAVLEHPAEEQDQALLEYCGDDAVLAAEVSAYLDAHARTAGFLEQAVGLDQPDQPELTRGETIGAYEVVRVLGRGGMGDVYLAVRADDAYERQVAIKLVKPGMDSREIVRRFHIERRILASLDHPGIARLLEAGSMPNGRPYLVMDYIEGKPIDVYCRDGELSLRSRLKIFRKVCDAVESAHRQLVVHRDLKPANILVNVAGEPKLLDFGIAKLLTEDTGWAETRVELRPMTLDYSSPEQLRGELITPAVDIHALGLLLYELLVGRHPYREESSTPEMVRRAICEGEPRAPSTMMSGASEGRLRRKLKGDLDAIVIKALRKEPKDRYASVSALGEDARRHLEGEPVQAHQGTALYRGSKFVRRAWRPLIVAASFVALLGIFLASTLRQGKEIALKAETAQRTADFMVELFAIVDPGEMRGEAVTAREILDRGVVRIEEELAEEPEIRAELAHTMGRVYGGLGLYNPAQRLFETALEAKITVHGNQSEELIETLLFAAGNRRHLGEYEEAERQSREALALAKEVYGDRHAQVARALDNLALILWTRGDLAAAEDSSRASLALKRALGEGYLGETLGNLGILLRQQGRFVEAEEALTEAVVHLRRTYGNSHPETITSLGNLAVAISRQGRGEEAAALLREVITLRREILDENHPEIGTSLNNLSSILHELGRDEEAEPYAREALRIHRQSLGDEHPGIAFALTNLAVIVHAQGQLDEASKLLLESEALRRIVGDEDLGVAISLSLRANVLLDRGSYAAAEPLLHEALAIYAKVLPEVHWRRAVAESALGESVAGQGRFQEAKPLLIESLPVIESQRGESSIHARRALRRLVHFHEEQGQVQHARPFRERLDRF